jgi:uncharacterized protein (DUF2062 family)
MFRRLRRPSFPQRLAWVLWPRTGWRRAGVYLAHRLRRLPGTPHSIAAGFAWGAAISFTPFLGLHFLFGAAGAWLMGGNLFASAVGTVVGNPWTFPLIWLASYRLGAFVLGQDGEATLPENLSMAYIFDNPEAVLLPMTLGGVPMAVLAWFVSYWIVRRAVDRYQQMRRARMLKGAARRLAAARGQEEALDK